jgi:hypothetical protein
MFSEYLFSGWIVAFVAWRVISSVYARRRVPGLLQAGAQIVDLRSPNEFAAGHAAARRVNISLADLQQRIGELETR